MFKKLLKIISVLLGLVAMYGFIQLISDRTPKHITALSKQYSVDKELIVNEKFTTDFESSYGIEFSTENPEENATKDSLQTDFEVLKEGKPIKIFINNSFSSKSGAEYELNLKISNASSKPVTLKVKIQTNVPGPAYELLVEREYEWVFWLINGMILLLALICGYFGFIKKPGIN
ncbi:hypothetical protein ACJD0Z_12860 [Flavobacteriaceae bacterium M23B6Z8]